MTRRSILAWASDARVCPTLAVTLLLFTVLLTLLPLADSVQIDRADLNTQATLSMSSGARMLRADLAELAFLAAQSAQQQTMQQRLLHRSLSQQRVHLRADITRQGSLLHDILSSEGKLSSATSFLRGAMVKSPGKATTAKAKAATATMAKQAAAAKAKAAAKVNAKAAAKVNAKAAAKAKPTAAPKPAGLPVCLFVHGAGQSANYQILNTFPAYWGKVDQSVKSLCTPKFVWYQSTERGWDDAQMSADVCRAISDTQPTVVITHSMANMVYASFKAKPALCKLPAGLKWISLQGPFNGSPAATACVTVCASNNILWLPVQKLSVGCNCLNKQPRASVKSLVPNYSSPTGITHQALSAAAKSADFMLCGNSAAATSFGLDSITLRAVSMLSSIVQSWGVDAKTSDVNPISGNDGMVPLRQSCVGDNDPTLFKQVPTNKYYFGHINHASGTMRDGDNKSDKSQQPVAFLINALTQLLKK